jgi:hypothetical protein
MVDIAQVSFNKGEVSPIAADRTDEGFYASALQTCVNFFLHSEGGASNRPGLGFVGACSSNTPSGSYLLPFIYNNEQTYVTEFGAGSIRFYSEGAFVQNTTSSATITGVNVTFDLRGENIITFQAVTTFAIGTEVTINGVVSSGSYNVNGVRTIATSNGSSFTVTASGSHDTFTYVSGGTASVALNLTNNYALTDLPSLRWAQSADVLNIVVSTQPLYQLKRLTANSFSFTAPQLLFGPFQDTNTDGTTTVYASAVQGTVTIFASKPIFLPGHVGALFSIQEQFLDSIQPWEAQKTLVNGTDLSPVGTYCRSDGKIYLCVGYNNPGNNTIICTGTYQPVHVSGTQMDGNGQGVTAVGACGVFWQFVSTDTGIAQITQYVSPTEVKAVIQSDKGIYANFPPTTVGGPVTAVGPFTFNGDGSTLTFSPLTAITTGDPNQFYVTVGGVFQDPSTYSIDQGSTSISFYSAPPAGTGNISVVQITGTLTNQYGTGTQEAMQGLCLSTYWAFGAISSVQGYASDVCYYNDRLVLSGTTLQPQTLFTSQVSNYLNFGVSDPQVDSDAITETINSRQQNPINNLLPMNNLLLGTASASWRVTDSSGIGAITPSNIALIPQEFYGMQDVPAVQTGTTILYVQWGGRKLRDIIYQFYNDKFLGNELTVFARHLFPVGTSIVRMAYAPEPYGLVYCVRSDGVMCVCTYLPEQQVLAWSRYITQGNFEDVCVIPEDGAFSVYVIVGRTVNGVYSRYIERFASREFADIDDAFFVDSGLTYDGRNTSAATVVVTGGTTWMAQDGGTVNSSINLFSPADPGNSNAVWLTDGDGNLITRLQIVTYLAPTSAQVLFLDPVPAAYQGMATSQWTFARTNFTGLTHLIGQTVAVFADGSVQPQQVVSATGSITLQNAGGVVHAGLPYASQLQSLNLNQQGKDSIRNRMKTIPRVSVVVDESLPFYMGPDFDTLVPVTQRQFETYIQPVQPYSGVLHVQLPTQQTDDAYVCLQMSDPAPVRVLGWMADVDIGEAG